MFKKSLFLLFLLSVFSIQAQDFQQNNTETKVTFKIKNFGVYVDGDFSDVAITTNLDTNNLAESYLNAEIKVKTIATGIGSRDRHILEEDYFDEPNHPTITLKSSGFEKNSDGTITMMAELTIKGKTKKMSIPLQVSEGENRLKITSKFEINRKEFKVGGGSLIMSKKVKIQVEYSGTR